MYLFQYLSSIQNYPKPALRTIVLYGFGHQFDTLGKIKSQMGNVFYVIGLWACLLGFFKLSLWSDVEKVRPQCIVPPLGQGS